MKTRVQYSVLHVAGCCALAAGALMLYGCVSTKSESSATGETYLINRPPVEAPPSVKAGDFRLSPPEVQDITVQNLGNGQALVAVKFANDRRLGRQVTIVTDERPVVLHDDGRDGDEKAGDHVYSAIVSLDVDALVAGQERELVALAKSKKPLTIHQFRGRDIAGEEKIDIAGLLDQLRNAKPNGPIRVSPFGLGWASVDPARSLFITDTNVVDDPNRTFDPCTGTGTPMGEWTFGNLMQQMANQSKTGIDPSDFVMNWLTNWLGAQTVNGFSVKERSAMQALVIDPWPKLPNGKLDLSKAPMKLLAIVNRIDLAANSAYGAAGGAEGRFVFGVTGSTNPLSNVCSPQLFTVIIEYGVPIDSCTGIRNWANQWLQLANFTLGSPAYNAALEAITKQFTDADADPSKPNGSALDQLRTDEFELAGVWELREFHISPGDGQLHEATVAQTPDRGTYDPAIFPAAPGAANLAVWINQNSAAVDSVTYTVPLDMPAPPAPAPPPSTPFRGGEVTNVLDIWNAPGITETNRHNFSLNTCNACHGAETGTFFLQVAPGGPGPASLSGFLTGITQTVPVNGPPDSGKDIHGNWINPAYTYNDLERRQQILYEDANSSCLFRIRIPVLLVSH
ncbi:MAG: hypothetical protein WAO21_02425 [Verrucomicrobiia bacterium]|jgi:hypothetical protein